MQNINSGDYELAIKVKEEEDIAISRRMAKQFAQNMGFSLADVTKIATAVSELSRNIYRYAGTGKIYIKKKRVYPEEEPCIEIVAFDQGPGIEDIELVLSGGYTTSKKSLGLGLSGVRRLMDKFYVMSETGKGTIVVVEKRRRRF